MSGETIITVVGNVTADPELRFTGSGVAVANFTVASTARIFDKASQEWKDSPDTLFLRCSIWRQAAENVAESITRGTRVVVTGKLKQRTYEKDGVKHTVIEMEAEEVAVSTKYATVKVTRAERVSASSGSGRGGSKPDDPWGSAPATSGGGYDSEPPF